MDSVLDDRFKYVNNFLHIKQKKYTYSLNAIFSGQGREPKDGK
jgi:hypothetical protein